MKRILKLSLTVLLLTVSTDMVQAAEGGNTQYAPGSAQFFAGAIPPYEGFYFLSQTSYFESDRLNDSNGDRLPVDFQVKTLVETLRFMYVSDIEVGGAKLWGQLVVPVVHLDLALPGVSDTRFGVADITTTVGLAWHPDQHQSFVLGVDFALPTGSYDSDRAANIGLNHWSVQPTLGYHYLDTEGLELGAVARIIFNSENPDTDYRSGNEFVLDYAVGWNFGRFKIGATGYYLTQLTDDSGPMAAVDGHRGRGFAIGPALTYNFTPATQLSASWEHDVIAKNRAQGDTVWLNFASKF